MRCSGTQKPRAWQLGLPEVFLKKVQSDQSRQSWNGEVLQIVAGSGCSGLLLGQQGSSLAQRQHTAAGVTWGAQRIQRAERKAKFDVCKPLHADITCRRHVYSFSAVMLAAAA
jgi:hypothetical protein